LIFYFILFLSIIIGLIIALKLSKTRDFRSVFTAKEEVIIEDDLKKHDAITHYEEIRDDLTTRAEVEIEAKEDTTYEDDTSIGSTINLMFMFAVCYFAFFGIPNIIKSNLTSVNSTMYYNENEGYNTESTQDGVYILVGETIGLAFDIVEQMRTDIPELALFLFLIIIFRRLTKPIVGLFSAILTDHTVDEPKKYKKKHDNRHPAIKHYERIRDELTLRRNKKTVVPIEDNTGDDEKDSSFLFNLLNIAGK